MKSLIQKAEDSHSLSKPEIIRLLEDNSINDELFGAADRVRKQFVGDEIHLRALIEFSNICSRNCFYCGVRAENKNIKRYRLMPDEIIQLAKNALNSGYKTIVLQSAEDMYYTAEMLADIIKEIKKNDTAVTLSIGERSYQEYKILKDAGADRFLLRIETTDKELYRKLHPNMSFENRVRCLKDLKKLGYETGTGCLVGLPDQTINSLADDILFFKELDADMVGLGPLIPHKDTPLKDVKAEGFWLSLKVTFKFAIVQVPLKLGFALLVALLLSKVSKGVGGYRVAFYVPSVLGLLVRTLHVSVHEYGIDFCASLS